MMNDELNPIPNPKQPSQTLLIFDEEMCNICHNKISGDYLEHVSIFHKMKFELIPFPEESKINRDLLNPIVPIGLNWITTTNCEICNRTMDMKEYIKHILAHKIEMVTPGNLNDVPKDCNDLPRTLYCSKGQDNICRICFEVFQDEEILIYLPCIHRFHELCISKWLENQAKCPICKRNPYQKC